MTPYNKTECCIELEKKYLLIVIEGIVSFISLVLSSKGDMTSAFDSVPSLGDAVSNVQEVAVVEDAGSVFTISPLFNLSGEFDVSREGVFLKVFRILNFRILRCKNSWRCGILDSYNANKKTFLSTQHFRKTRKLQS